MGRFRRVLVVLDHAYESAVTVRTAARWAPEAEYVHCVRLVPSGVDAEPNQPDAPELTALPSPELVAWRRKRPAMQVDSSWVMALDLSALDRLIARLEVDLVVVAPLEPELSRERAQLVLHASVRGGCHVLSVGQVAASALEASEPAAEASVCAAVDAAGMSVPSLAAFLGELSPEENAFALAMLSRPPNVDLAELFERELPRPLPLQAASAPSPNLIDAVQGDAVRAGACLIVAGLDAAPTLDRLALDVVSAASLDRAGCPVLLLPRSPALPALCLERLCVSDGLVLPGKPVRLLVERTGAFGAATVESSLRLAVKGGGQASGPVPHADGVATLPPALCDALGDRDTRELVTRAGETAQTALLRQTRPWILIDSTLDRLPLRSIEAKAEAFQLVFVRLRHTLGLEENRERLRKYARVLGVAHLVDAACFLEDAGSESLPTFVDGLRLLRVAEQLQLDGARIAAIVTRHGRVRSDRLPVLSERTWAEAQLLPNLARALPSHENDAALHAELDAFTSSETQRGNKVLFEVDNAAARRDLMQSLAAARERIHLFATWLPGDDVSQRLLFALKSAAERGVEVRVLLPAAVREAGHEKALLAELSQMTRLQVATLRSPLSEMYTAWAGQRNPLTLALFDGRRAFLSGRALGGLFLRGLEEVTISGLSSCDELPWVGSGLHLQGPVVTQLERWFLERWVGTGQGSFFVRACPRVGPVALRLVVHQGLRDTRALAAQLALIRHARNDLVLVNSFPLAVEASQALLAAVKRGVRVRMLFGNLRPRTAEASLAGAAFTPLSDQLVRAALDELVKAGAEVLEYARPAPARWDSALSTVFPPLHAKVLMRDGQDVAIGTGELDASAAYWEDELLVVAHDDHFAANVQATLAPLFDSAERVDPQSTGFRLAAAQRRALGHGWPRVPR